MRTSRGLERFITFLDAVVAIAITLLVLPLVDILTSETSSETLSHVLGDHRSDFGAFLLSFAVIARLWLAHHHLAEYVGSYNSPFLLINLGWVLTIIFLPFASQTAAVYGGNDRLAVAIYVGTVAASSICLSGLALLLRHKPELRREGSAAHEVGTLGSIMTSALMIVALVLAVAVPAINYWALLLLLLSDPIERALRRPSAPQPG